MSDCEDIVFTKRGQKHKSKHKKSKISDRDDLGGMFINMGRHVDPREIFIIWIVFLFLHTEMFADTCLKKINNATNDDMTLTMKGTFIASLIMALVVIICSMIF